MMKSKIFIGCDKMDNIALAFAKVNSLDIENRARRCSGMTKMFRAMSRRLLAQEGTVTFVSDIKNEMGVRNFEKTDR